MAPLNCHQLCFIGCTEFTWTFKGLLRHVYMLSCQRKRRTFSKVLEKVKQLNSLRSTTRILMDFESAAINAGKNFPPQKYRDVISTRAKMFLGDLVSLV